MTVQLTPSDAPDLWQQATSPRRKTIDRHCSNDVRPRTVRVVRPTFVVPILIDTTRSRPEVDRLIAAETGGSHDQGAVVMGVLRDPDPGCSWPMSHRRPSSSGWSRAKHARRSLPEGVP